MFSFINRTVFDIPLTWDRTHFESTRAKYRKARKLIENSVNVQFEKQLRNLSLENINMENNITETNEHLLKHDKKVSIFDNLVEIASQSLPDHFDKRMEIARTSIEEHCNAVQKILQQENEYWKEIHTAIDQNLITLKDIHPSVQNNSESRSNDSPILINSSSVPEDYAPTKQERISIVLPLIASNKVLPSVNKTYVVKPEETINNSLPEMETLPTYSQPNFPPQLYFSPTILQNEESGSIRNILSPLDQNQTDKTKDFSSEFLKPKVLLQRVGHTFLLNHLKSEGNNNISIPSKRIIDSIRSESNNHYPNCFIIPESETHSAIKIPSELVSETKTTRKRKQSVSEEIDTKSNTIALRKRKSVSFVEVEDEKPTKKVTRRRRDKKTKENQIPIREPSPLPSFDRSKHYTTRFSTRTQRFTLNIDADDDDCDESESHPRLRKKPIKSTKKEKTLIKCCTQ